MYLTVIQGFKVLGTFLFYKITILGVFRATLIVKLFLFRELFYVYKALYFVFLGFFKV